MKRLKHPALAAMLALWLAISPLLQASACAPEFPFAVIVNQCHPDLPLKFFAAGKLGVIQPAWAKSYLCVVYRYLTDNPLDATEQASIQRLWNSRLQRARFYSGNLDRDPIMVYLDLRAKVLGKKQLGDFELYSATDTYSSKQDIFKDAFVVAARALSERIKNYGLKSTRVRDWVKAQDLVFGVGASGANHMPAPLPTGADPLAKADRAYQIAAATFYNKDYSKAEQLFNNISKDQKSPWKSIASYMVARCKANSQGPAEQTIAFLESRLKSERNSNIKADLYDLLKPISYVGMSDADLLAQLVKSVMSKHSDRFGGDVGDLTYVMEETVRKSSPDGDSKPSTKQEIELTKNDLTDWINTVQRSSDPYFFYNEDEQKALAARRKELDKHAIDMWRKNQSTPWLVAAISLNGLQSPDLKDLYEAAMKIPSTSPAYLTASFHLVDALIASQKHNEARQRLAAILSRKDLSPSNRNLFKAQMLPICTTVEQYLSNCIVTPPEVCLDSLQLPDQWEKAQASTAYHSDTPTFEKFTARDLNRNLPLSYWVKLSLDTTVPARLRGQIVRSTWLRAHLLEKPDTARQLSAAFAAAYPVLAGQIRQVDSAAAGDAKRFALASLVLTTFGMSPYVAYGVERHGDSIKEFDEYNANFWLPLPVDEKPSPKKDGDSSSNNGDEDGGSWWAEYPSEANKLFQTMQGYSTPGVRRLLSSQQRRTADSERATIWRNGPSRFFGEAVFKWANSRPNDPQIPELLYKVVKLPKWTQITQEGSKYSHKAYNLLHSRYAGSKWASKATCWY